MCSIRLSTVVTSIKTKIEAKVECILIDFLAEKSLIEHDGQD